jgi:hypothetical protein
MPTDESYQAVLHELSNLAGEWRIYRDTVNRALIVLNSEVVTFSKRLDRDDVARVIRQHEVDGKLDAIKRWQWWWWIRVVIETVLLLMAIAYIYGVNR